MESINLDDDFLNVLKIPNINHLLLKQFNNLLVTKLWGNVKIQMNYNMDN